MMRPAGPHLLAARARIAARRRPAPPMPPGTVACLCGERPATRVLRFGAGIQPACDDCARAFGLGDADPIAKVCRACGRFYASREWRALPLCGEQIDHVERLELRHCECGSTISIVVETYLHDETDEGDDDPPALRGPLTAQDVVDIVAILSGQPDLPGTSWRRHEGDDGLDQVDAAEAAE